MRQRSTESTHTPSTQHTPLQPAVPGSASHQSREAWLHVRRAWPGAAFGFDGGLVEASQALSPPTEVRK